MDPSFCSLLFAILASCTGLDREFIKAFFYLEIHLNVALFFRFFLMTNGLQATLISANTSNFTNFVSHPKGFYKI
jgi:hypothetical protein